MVEGRCQRKGGETEMQRAISRVHLMVLQPKESAESPPAVKSCWLIMYSQRLRKSSVGGHLVQSAQKKANFEVRSQCSYAFQTNSKHIQGQRLHSLEVSVALCQVLSVSLATGSPKSNIVHQKRFYNFPILVHNNVTHPDG